jgi:hypothetical protein
MESKHFNLFSHLVQTESYLFLENNLTEDFRAKDSHSNSFTCKIVSTMVIKTLNHVCYKYIVITPIDKLTFYFK